MSRWIVELRGEDFHVTHEHCGVAVEARPSTEDGFHYAECSKCSAIRVVIPGDERGARARAAKADDSEGHGPRDGPLLP
jgi:hypothetical protein